MKTLVFSRQHTRRFRLLYVAVIVALLLSLAPSPLPGTQIPVASAHNLQTRDVYAYFDLDTQTMLDARINGVGWTPPTPLLQVGDELGLVMRGVPKDGTTTGVGGYLDFYIPTGVTVLDAAYLAPVDNVSDGITGYDRIPMKGQSPIAIGAGPVGAKIKTEMIGLTLGPNINGVTEATVNASGLMRGTIAGVYGDTGIFYATHPDTAWNTWATTGGYDQNIGTNDNTVTNNSGDVIVPLNKWDAEQLLAWGAKAPIIAIVDTPDQRGNAPWGLANGVAGPQSGYAWDFDWDGWRASAQTAADMRAASNQLGPWQRIAYPGSRVSKDQAGLISSVLGFTSEDASSIGTDLTTGDLPPTTSQTDGASPKVLRFSVGQTTQYVPEYVWVKMRIDSVSSGFIQPDGCPYWNTGAFGGDAGGSDNGKDHLWRYYEPTIITLNGCVAVGKPATVPAVKVGDIFSYKVKFYNAGTVDLTNVVVKDQLPSGVLFISALPAQNSGPNPLVWNVGTLLRGQKFEATVTVKATGTGPLENIVTVTTNQFPPVTATEITPSGAYPMLSQVKSVSPTTVAPGGTVQYTITISNYGTGASGSPVTIQEYLPTGFTYVSKDSVTVNGANVTATTTVNTGNPNQPLFTVPSAINAGQSLVLKFTAQVPSGATAGSYCNYFTTTHNGVPSTTGSQACVAVGGGAIGDTLFRDWDGDGSQDPEDEGLSGVTVNLYAGACPPSGGPLASATTDANGNYLFSGLTTPASFCVDPLAPAGYTSTTPPEPRTVTLTANQTNLTADFGFQPGGVASIGDKVFDDVANDGVFNGADVGINGVTVTLYEDTNGNGVIDPGQDALIGTTTTSGGGNYSFTGLDPTRSYIVAAADGPGSAVDAYFANPYASSTGGGGSSNQAVSPADFTAQGNAVTDADFGYFGQTPGSIGDTVCIDADGDKDCDGSDQGLAGVTVTLYRDANSDGVPDPGELVTTTSTDAAGHYLFDTLGPGSYIVVVDTGDPQIPAGYLPSTADQVAVTLAVAQNRTDVDFPFGRVLTKAVSPAHANPGDTLYYTITANYPSAVLLQNVTITDAVPTGTTFVSAGQDGQQSAGVITWNLGSNTDDIPATTAAAGTALCYASTALTAIEDTYVNLAAPTTNYGAATTMVTRPANASNLKHSLLRFDTSAIPASAQILIADLRVVVTSNRTNHVDEVHRMTTTWTEAGATWNDADGGGAGDWAAGTFGAGDYSATLLGKLTPSSNGAKNLSLVPVVADWVNNGIPNRGLVLLSTGADGGDAAYATSENGTTANRPTLTVGYYYESLSPCSGAPDLVAVADAYVNQNSASSSYGAATTMSTAPSNNSRQLSSLVRFDLAPIPPGATITSATFKPTVTTKQNGASDQVRPLLTAWTESATWNDADGSGSGDWAASSFSSSDYGASLGAITPTSTGQKSLAITSQVNDWVNNGVPNRGLALIGVGSNNNKAVKYGTREHTTTGSRPILTVSWSQAVNTLPQTTLELHAEPLFLGGAGQIKVTMTASSAGTVSGVTPPASLTINATGGASAVLNSGPTPPGPVTISPGSPASFVYIYDVTPGSLPGSLSFTGKPAPAANFGTATSEGVIVSPALTFQVTVNNPATVTVVENVANISASEPDTRLGPDLCYLVADNNPDTSTADRLLSIDPITGDFVDIGATSTNNMEALTWNLDGTVLYGVEAGQLVTVDKDTGARTVVGTIGAINGTFGSIATPDVDGLSFDPADGKLYAVARREDGTNGNTLLDVLFQIAPATGARVANAYGAGVDYIAINTNTLSPALYDVDDIAFDDAGVLYAIANDATTNMGLSDRLVTLHKATGAVTDIAGFLDAADGTTAVTDVEGLSFLPGVGLLASTGDASTTTAQRNTVWTVDADTAEMTAIIAVPAYSQTDYEGLACLPGPFEPGDLILPPTPSNHVDTPLGASIGDLVWADVDGDGIKDANEPGLAGVEVCATPTVGGATVCVVTDSLGNYTLGGLTNGTSYNVTVTLSTVPPGYVPTTPTTLTVTATTAGTLTADFGLQPPGTATIGDTVWLDADEDGTLDPTENGLPGVTVRLYQDANNNGVIDAGDTLLQTDVTDANGNYLFSGLNPDDFLVQVDPTSPVTTTFGVVTTIGAAMSTTAGATNPRDVTVTAAGQTITNADFGYNWGGSIGDRLWYDDDGDGIGPAGTPGGTDTGEPYVAVGGVLNLYYDSNGNGAVDPGEPIVAVAFSDAVGYYLFDNLPPGNYVVKAEEQQIPAPVSSPHAGQIGYMVASTGSSAGVSLSGNQAYTQADFGFIEAGEVSGHVFHDANSNGVFDAGETPLPNVTVTLTGADLNGNPVSLTTTTDAAGEYEFVAPPGNYTITYNTGDPDIPPALTQATTPVTVSLALNAGAEVGGIDFGRDHPGSVGDTLFVDANGNGLQDSGEPGLANVTVSLYDSSGTTLLATTVSDASGHYLFTGLPDATYEVRIVTATLPTDYAQTADPDQTGACTTCDNRGAATVSGGGSDLTLDFGYQYQPGGIPASTNTISGVLWNDQDGDGVFDVGEPMLTGVSVVVDCGANGTFLATTGALVLGHNWSV
ncbi:MAG: SdrD B-like domain-containing protein, partial [Anaerolineae bacterium]